MTKRLFLAGVLVLLSGPALAQTTVQPTTGFSTDISGTVTLGGTYQTVAAASNTRRNCTIQNPSSATESLSVKLGTMVSPYVLGAGQSFSTLNATVGANDAITLTATTTNHAFAGSCQ
jgi:opacity protein-like surface antigen